jgi:hypothetical protein
MLTDFTNHVVLPSRGRLPGRGEFATPIPGMAYQTVGGAL